MLKCRRNEINKIKLNLSIYLRPLPSFFHSYFPLVRLHGCARVRALSLSSSHQQRWCLLESNSKNGIVTTYIHIFLLSRHIKLPEQRKKHWNWTGQAKPSWAIAKIYNRHTNTHSYRVQCAHNKQTKNDDKKEEWNVVGDNHGAMLSKAKPKWHEFFMLTHHADIRAQHFTK